MKKSYGWGSVALLSVLAAYAIATACAKAPAAARNTATASGYRVLAPIESGRLLLFPVVRVGGELPAQTPFLTLDEGLRSGEVEVTEASRARGLVRPRGAAGAVPNPSIQRGDEVNTLVLINHSEKPLLLLAGEIVTGGKQDRIIAGDRIVPAESDPIDLSVFCIEPGRWTGSSAAFGAAAKIPAHGFMVQPEVRRQAMVAKDQQQVWDSVHGAISAMAMAAAPSASGGSLADMPATTSYARMMQSSAVSEKVDKAAAPAVEERAQVLEKLRAQHAVGVVVAVRGEIVWADLFANTDLLARYWTKLVRSYAAESLEPGQTHPAPAIADAQRFLDEPASGAETSQGELGVYRNRELRSGETDTFVLESLLPGADYDVHISKMKLRTEIQRIGRPHPVPRPVPSYPYPYLRPDVLR